MHVPGFCGCLGAAVFGLAAAASAQSPAPTAEAATARLSERVGVRGGFFEVRSRHYLVRTEIDARFTAELAAFMDRMHDGFAGLFPGPAKVDIVPEVVVFADRDRYRRVAGDNSRAMFRWEYESRAGVRTMTEFALYSYVADPAQREFARFPRYLLLHEGTHQLLQTRAGYHAVPPWFQEGCAMVLEQWDLDDTPDRNVERIVARRRTAAAVAEALRRRQLPALRDLAGLPRLDVDGFGRRTALNYQQAEALFCFLLAERGRRRMLSEAYAELVAGRPADGILFSGARGAALETDWLDWLRAAGRK